MKFSFLIRLQTVRIFTYSITREQSNKRSGMRLKQRARLGRDFFSLASHAPRACEARALRARKTLTPRFTDFFTDFEKKTDCFAVYFLIYSSTNQRNLVPTASRLPPLFLAFIL